MTGISHELIKDLSFPGSNSPHQSFDLYLPVDRSERLTQLIIYVHGGAWRTGDKGDKYSIGLIQNLSGHFPSAAIGSINYRPSTVKEDNDTPSEVKHPAHNQDVVKSIDQLHSLPELKDIEKTYLIGHSVGAFICLSIAGIMDPPSIESPKISSFKKNSGLILIDGIYDLVQLLEEYPSYNSFILPAFEERSQDQLKYLADVSPLSWLAPSIEPENLPKILIIHSRQDTLLTVRQSKIAADSLQLKLRPGDKLEVDFDSISGDHDELLLSPELALRIRSFILGL